MNDRSNPIIIEKLSSEEGITMVWHTGIVVAAALFQAGPVLDGVDGKVDTGRMIALDYDMRCTPSQAFRLWTTQDGVTFFAPKARIDGRVGQAFEFMFQPDIDPDGANHGTKDARLLALIQDRFIAFEWDVFAGDTSQGNGSPPYAPPKIHNERPLPTWVEISLQPQAGGSHISFRHYGFRDTPLWEESRLWFTRGWQGVFAAMDVNCKMLAADQG